MGLVGKDGMGLWAVGGVRGVALFHTAISPRWRVLHSTNAPPQKQDLLAKYTSDTLLMQQEAARALLNKK